MLDVEKAISGKEGILTNYATRSNCTTTDSALTATTAIPENHLATTQNLNNINTSLNSTLTVSNSTVAHNCCSISLKIIFSTPGLVLLVICYSVLGAFIFPLIETPQDITKAAAIAKSREDCLRELWIITEKLNVLYERNWTMLVHEQLLRFESSIVAATRQGMSISPGSTTTAVGHFGGDDSTAAGALEHWTFSQALLYSVTVITTIGHGSLTPKSAAGKIATIFYALIGVPLMLMCLSSLGALLAEALQCTYARLCCQLQARSPGRSNGREKSRHKRRCSAENVDGDKQTSSNLNCKNCKYDAINDERSGMDKHYHCGGKQGNMLHEHDEDSCQLLRPNASPEKLNPQQTTYMQSQYYQQQQQQKQRLQQPQSSTTLSTTMTTEATLNPATMQQQKHTCTQSATSSSQHLQQQYYLTTTLPRAQHRQQQHFVALPSSILRFSLTAAGAVSPTTLPQSAPTSYYTTPTGSATATLYFPVAATPATDSNMSSSLSTTTGRVHYQQPLVKYHTIQLQPSATKRLLATNDISANTLSTAVTAANSTATTLNAMTLPTLLTLPPPPPPYQTAMVPGIRRAKFLTKPLPQTLNTLLTESSNSSTSSGASAGANGSCVGIANINYGLDLFCGSTTTTSESVIEIETKAVTTTTIASTADNTLMSAGVCDATKTMSIITAQASAKTTTTTVTTTSTYNTLPAATTTTTTTPATMTDSQHIAAMLQHVSSTIDVMEDDDEQEQQRLGNCPHGTPSRVPLIADSITTQHKSNINNTPKHEKDYKKPHSGGTNSSSGSSSSAAAAFNRYTLQQPSLNRKTLLLTRRGCQMHQTIRSGSAFYDSAAMTETSDDDYDADYMQHDSEQFVLKNLKTSDKGRRCVGSSTCITQSEFEDDDEDEIDDETASVQRFMKAQVPISIVLLILVCYICVGTVIFAFWENWSFIDGAYFCFVTLSTIGYGDFVPSRTFQGPKLQLYACCAYLLLGLVLVAMSFSILETQLMWKCRRIAVRLKLAKD